MDDLLDDDEPELIKVLSVDGSKADNMQRLIECGKQSFIHALKRCKYSEPWFDAWIRVAANNLEHLALALRVANDEYFKEATAAWDKLMLRIDRYGPAGVNAPRLELLLLVCGQGGLLPTAKNRKILSNRQKIAKSIDGLLSLIKADPEISKNLSGNKFYALAFDPLCYHLRNAPGAPSLTMAEHRSAPTLEKILEGVRTRIEAELPFGIIQKPLETSPTRLGSDAQRTQFERVMLDRLRRWFGKAHHELCALFVNAAFGLSISGEEVRQRDVLCARRKRQRFKAEGDGALQTNG